MRGGLCLLGIAVDHVLKATYFWLCFVLLRAPTVQCRTSCQAGLWLSLAVNRADHGVSLGWPAVLFCWYVADTATAASSFTAAAIAAIAATAAAVSTHR